MSDESPEQLRRLRAMKSGDQLGDLLAPAAGGAAHAVPDSSGDTGLDDELAAILSSVEQVEPVGGASLLEIPDEPDDGLVDSEGVLTIDLPDEIPPEVSSEPESSARPSRSAPTSTPPASSREANEPAGATGSTDATENPADPENEDDTPGIGRRRRRRRNPFANMEQVSSSQAGMTPRDLMSLSDLKRIKRARVRHDGQRVITDDVKKLKSLTIEPHLPPGEYINYYVEPVRIEYYIPKESRFAVETRFLYIPLIDPEPRPGLDDQMLKAHIEQNRFVDIVDIMNEYPRYITDILESYNTTMGLYESLSRAIQEADEGSDESYRKAFYLCEVLMDYEPTLASLNFLGDFLAWNINWLVRAMNALGLEFAAADKTISYLIKKRNTFWEENNLKYDERFETLAALFYEQAFPNRGLEDVEEDYFYDIFDKKFQI